MVDFIQLALALGALESSTPNLYTDLMAVYDDSLFVTQAIGNAVWLSHVNLSNIPVMCEEWFKEQYGQTPRIHFPCLPSPHIYEGGSLTSSGATTERTTTEGPSPHPEIVPFTLANAVQSTMEGLASATSPDPIVTTVPLEGSPDQDMDSPDTSPLASPCAAMPIAPPPTAAGADTTPRLSPDTSPDAQPAAVADVAAAAPSVPPPEMNPKARPRAKAKAAAK